MADYLGYTFIDSINWVKFNFDGTINYETSYNALLQITEGNKVVIPGFYGVMRMDVCIHLQEVEAM